MTAVEYSAVLETRAEHAWKVLRKFGGIADWHPAIAHSRIEDGQPDDIVGSVRRLDMADGSVIRERLLSLDDSRMSLSYQFEESPLPIDNYLAHVTVFKVSGEQQCLIEWKASFDVREPADAKHFHALITEVFMNAHISLTRLFDK